MHLAEQSWPELGESLDGESLAVVPTGSTEQHGPHLPLATDYLIAEALAAAATNETGHVLTPPVRIGVSEHHRQFHGTMWVEPEVFRDYVESFVRNLTTHGFDRVLFVNAHGGNTQHLREVGRRLRRDRTAYAIEWMWDESIPDLVNDLFEYNGPHGGPKETAMIMHIARELVREDKLEDARDGGLVDLTAADARVHGARTFYETLDNSENGVFGDQTDATPEKGAELFDAATEQLVHLLDWLDEQRFEDLMPKPHVE
jgi:creatinine amidohydrolase